MKNIHKLVWSETYAPSLLFFMNVELESILFFHYSKRASLRALLNSSSVCIKHYKHAYGKNYFLLSNKQWSVEKN